jgi:hypothetical protein
MCHVGGIVCHACIHISSIHHVATMDFAFSNEQCQNQPNSFLNITKMYYMIDILIPKHRGTFLSQILSLFHVISKSLFLTTAFHFFHSMYRRQNSSVTPLMFQIILLINTQNNSFNSITSFFNCSTSCLLTSN